MTTSYSSWLLVSVTLKNVTMAILQLVWLNQWSCYPLRQVLYLFHPCQTQRREKVFIKMYLSLGTQVLSSLTCGYAPNVQKTRVLGRSVCRGTGASSCKRKNVQVSSLKSYLWWFLEHSIGRFDELDAPPDGSCTPIKEELIPSIRELSHPKRGLSHWWWTRLTTSWAL